MRVILFNHWHNGDVHLSRGVVRQMIKKVEQIAPATEFIYSHHNPSNLLLDIPNLGFDPDLVNTVDQHDNLVHRNDTVFINSWYNQQHSRYMSRYGVSFDSLYAAFDDTCQSLWNFSLSDISTDVRDFFPVIDYEAYEIERARQWLSLHLGKKILVENGPANSGQAINFAMAPLILQAAQRHPDYSFILSQRENNTFPPNVFYTSDIIGRLEGSDLNEISFLSNYCDVVIGRASGVFSFALTRANLFERRVKFLCFSNLVPNKSNKFWLSSLLQDRVEYKSQFTVSGTSDIWQVVNLLSNALQGT